MASPDVSIIVPVFNYAKFLDKTLSHLQAQQLTNWECIIVDDGSTDDTSIVSRRFTDSDPRFKYIHQKNQGLSSARNTGIKQAVGEYIQLLDADDMISPLKLSCQVKFMELRPDVGISYTDAVYFDDANPSITFKSFTISKRRTPVFSDDEWIPVFDDTGIRIIDHLLLHNLAPVNSFLVRKIIFREIGGFNEDYSSLEDWEMWFRCALAGIRFAKFEHVDAFAKIRVHTNSMSFNSHKMNLHLIKLQKKMMTQLAQANFDDAMKVINRNKKPISKHIRYMIRETGLFNFKLLSQFAKEIGTSKFIFLYSREVFRALKNV